jgi:large subunit ribosomal protein L10
MALTKQKKAEQVERLAGDLQGSTSAIVGTFAKLTVAQDFALRKVVREAGGRYKVLKNKLAARAAKGTPVEEALQGLKGVSSVAYTSGDPVALTKALSTWVGENAEFTFKLGIVDGRVIGIDEIKQLATMPGKEELFSKLLFLINAPAQRLATVINATGRDLAVVLDQAVKENKLTGGAGSAAAAASAPGGQEAAPAAGSDTAAAGSDTAASAAAGQEAAPVAGSEPAAAGSEAAGSEAAGSAAGSGPGEAATSAQVEQAGSEAPAEGGPASAAAE